MTHAATQLFLSANSLMGRSYEACSSIKIPDVLFMQIWHWRAAVVQQHSFCYQTLGTHCHRGCSPLKIYTKYAYFDRTARHNASKKSDTEGIRLIIVF